VRLEEKPRDEILYKLFNARVLEWENSVEAAKNH